MAPESVLQGEQEVSRFYWKLSPETSIMLLLILITIRTELSRLLSAK